MECIGNKKTDQNISESRNVADSARVCTPLASVGMEEDVDAEGMHEIPERDLDPLRLCRIIGALQARVLELERELLGGVGNLPRETFFALMGFRDVATVRFIKDRFAIEVSEETARRVLVDNVRSNWLIIVIRGKFWRFVTTLQRGSWLSSTQSRPSHRSQFPFSRKWRT